MSNIKNAFWDEINTQEDYSYNDYCPEEAKLDILLMPKKKSLLEKLSAIYRIIIRKDEIPF